MSNSLKDVLFVIPCRAGSKRLPGKHMRRIGRKTLIQYTFDYMRQEGLLDQTVVVTDDINIAHHSACQGVRIQMETPRSTESTVISLAYALDVHNAEFVALVQADSPIRPPKLFHNIFQEMQTQKKQAGYAAFAEPPFNPTSLIKDGKPILGAGPTQTFGCQFISWAGNIWHRSRFIVPTFESVYSTPAALYIHDPWPFFDIDTPADLEMFELYVKSHSMRR